MTDAPETPTSADSTPSPAKPPKTGLLVSVGVLNLLVSGAVLGVVFLRGPSSASAGAEVESPVEAPLVSAALEPFVVNLNEPGSNRYLKTSLEFELRGKPAVDRLDARKREVRDELLSYLSGLTVADTLGEDNKNRIREAVMERLERILGPDMVARLYFTDFVVQ